MSDQQLDQRLDQRTVTPRRRAANQAAALKSTGPQSPEGKQRAAFNSFKHGVFAEQENVRAQFFSHSDRDPAELTDLRARLLSDWQPSSAQQALLVGDLAWLYWLRDEAAQALIDRQARQSLRDELARDERRFMDRHRARALKRRDYRRAGCLNLPGSDEKFAVAARVLDQIGAWASRAEWASYDNDYDADEYVSDNNDDDDSDDDEYDEDILLDLWGCKPSLRGAQARVLWLDCKRDHAKPDDPRAQRLRALIEAERAALAEEQALFRRRQALNLDEPDDEHGVRALGETWLKAVGAVERLDRQINAKVRLLIRLRAVEASSGDADVAQTSVTEVCGLSPADAQPPGGAYIAPSAMCADTDSANSGIAGTKPSKPLESTKPADEAGETGAELAEPAGPATPVED